MSGTTGHSVARFETEFRACFTPLAIGESFVEARFQKNESIGLDGPSALLVLDGTMVLYSLAVLFAAHDNGDVGFELWSREWSLRHQ